MEPSEILRQWRDKEGLSRVEAATLLEVSIHSYRSYEQGRRRAGLETACKIEGRTGGAVLVEDLIDPLPDGYQVTRS